MYIKFSGPPSRDGDELSTVPACGIPQYRVACKPEYQPVLPTGSSECSTTTGYFFAWTLETNTRLAWQSLPGSQVGNAGKVRFADAPGGLGTGLHAVVSYHPPAGALGKAAARLFNEVFEQLVKEDLRRVKRLLETGELPTIDGQPAGRTHKPLLARLTMF